MRVPDADALAHALAALPAGRRRSLIVAAMRRTGDPHLGQVWHQFGAFAADVAAAVDAEFEQLERTFDDDDDGVGELIPDDDEEAGGDDAI